MTRSLVRLDKKVNYHKRINSQEHESNLNQLLYHDKYASILSIKMEEEDPFFKIPKSLT
jgi:hypothetical protein